MERNWLELVRQNRLAAVLKTNKVTERYGLTLTQEDAELILEAGQNALRQERRVELGEGIAEKIIFEFCDSAYIEQSNFAETIARLQEIFFLYKNEMLDEISDEELLHFMKEQFETVCFGDLEYLEGTCLDIFAQAIRAGYQGHRQSQGRGEFGKLDPVQRWDYQLYLEALQELCWR